MSQFKIGDIVTIDKSTNYEVLALHNGKISKVKCTKPPKHSIYEDVTKTAWLDIEWKLIKKKKTRKFI